MLRVSAVVHQRVLALKPCPVSELSVDKLHAVFDGLERQELRAKIRQLCDVMRREDSVEDTVDAFYHNLPRKHMRCDLGCKGVAIHRSQKDLLKATSYESVQQFVTIESRLQASGHRVRMATNDGFWDRIVTAGTTGAFLYEKSQAQNKSKWIFRFTACNLRAWANLQACLVDDVEAVNNRKRDSSCRMKRENTQHGTEPKKSGVAPDKLAALVAAKMNLDEASQQKHQPLVPLIEKLYRTDHNHIARESARKTLSLVLTNGANATHIAKEASAPNVVHSPRQQPHAKTEDQASVSLKIARAALASWRRRMSQNDVSSAKNNPSLLPFQTPAMVAMVAADAGGGARRENITTSGSATT
ncbi:hypothetical protein PybrP1_000523, partial [[Pythium] brassicae (nom. inval.)]